ncbi:hypothetical protein JH26_01160 [Microvirga sp. BSC39]|nr:hypothetical protein JH26_01160 [Microvirga sp. BSC39]
MTDTFARPVAPTEAACRIVDSGHYDIASAMEAGTTPKPVPPQFNVQEGEEALAQHQFLRAVVLEDLPSKSWKKSVSSEGRKQTIPGKKPSDLNAGAQDRILSSSGRLTTL